MKGITTLPYWALAHYLTTSPSLPFLIIFLVLLLIVILLYKLYVSYIIQSMWSGLRVLSLNLCWFFSQSFKVSIFKFIDISGNIKEALLHPLAFIGRVIFKVLHYILRQIIEKVIFRNVEYFKVRSGYHWVWNWSFLEKYYLITYPFMAGN